MEENKFSNSLDTIKQLEKEFESNTHAMNELRQLQMLFEYYSEKLTDKTNQLEKSNEELQEQTHRAEHLANFLTFFKPF